MISNIQSSQMSNLVNGTSSRASSAIESRSTPVIADTSSTTGGAAGGVGRVNFSDVLTEAVDQVRGAFAESKEATTGALLGNVAPHTAMLAMSKADLTFRFVTQTRNKVVEAYREMMSLQV